MISPILALKYKCKVHIKVIRKTTQQKPHKITHKNHYLLLHKLKTFFFCIRKGQEESKE